MTKEEKLGLDALKNNPEIVLKKADKGSAVVVMNTTDYLREGYRQLSDPNFYQQEASGASPTDYQMIRKVYSSWLLLPYD